MRIAVFGATGMAGRATVTESLVRGHHVLAASRRSSTTTVAHERLASRRVDVADRGAVDAMLADADGSSRITPPDFAIAVLDDLEHPGDDPHFTVVHGDVRE